MLGIARRRPCVESTLGESSYPRARLDVVNGVPMTLGPLMVDVAGLSLSRTERTRLLAPCVGAVVLFARNFVSRAQVRALVAEIHSLRTPHLLIGVDQEGGRVQRFREGFYRLPPCAGSGINTI